MSSTPNIWYFRYWSVPIGFPFWITVICPWDPGYPSAYTDKSTHQPQKWFGEGPHTRMWLYVYVCAYHLRNWKRLRNSFTKDSGCDMNDTSPNEKTQKQLHSVTWLAAVQGLPEDLKQGQMHLAWPLMKRLPTQSNRQFSGPQPTGGSGQRQRKKPFIPNIYSWMSPPKFGRMTRNQCPIHSMQKVREWEPSWT